MDELIDRTVAATGLDPMMVAPAVAILVAYLLREAPAGSATSLLAALPGAARLVAVPRLQTSVERKGVFQQIIDLGWRPRLVTRLVSTVVGFCRERVGDDVMDDVLRSTPGIAEVA